MSAYEKKKKSLAGRASDDSRGLRGPSAGKKYQVKGTGKEKCTYCGKSPSHMTADHGGLCRTHYLQKRA